MKNDINVQMMKALRFAQMVNDYQTIPGKEWEEKYPEEYAIMRMNEKSFHYPDFSFRMFLSQAKKVFED